MPTRCSLNALRPLTRSQSSPAAGHLEVLVGLLRNQAAARGPEGVLNARASLDHGGAPVRALLEVCDTRLELRGPVGRWLIGHGFSPASVPGVPTRILSVPSSK